MVVIKMENEKFYKNTKYAPQNKMVTRFIKMNVTPGKAIDLGCGAGRDTVYLIKNGWDVLAIDRVDTEKIIVNQLNQEEQKRFRFEKQNFKDIKLETTNLVVANFSIPFCIKNKFNKLNIKTIGLASSKVGTTMVNLGMKKFHDSSVKLFDIDINDITL